MSSIDLVILGIVLEKPQSAYDIQKDVEYHHFSRWTKISVPSIYRKVLQLSEKGYLQSDIVKGDKFADTTRRTIPLTAMTGSNTPPVCMSRPRKSCWSVWIVSAIFGTLSTPCRRSKAVGWMLTSFSARATGRLLGTRVWTKAPSAILYYAVSRP